VNWVLDADIRGFFDRLDREWLMKFLRHRIADERVLRLVAKWLNAGVIEDGQWSDSGEGTPQGGSLSPLLANVYLHYVLDLLADWWRKTHARGNVIIVRFADDFVVGFQHQDDAERFLGELRGRLAKFSLELHPEKTRLIEFGPYAARDRRPGARGNRRRSRSWDSGMLPDDQRALLGSADHGQEEDGGQAEAGESRDHAPPPPASPRTGAMAGLSDRGAPAVLRGARQLQHYAVPGNFNAVKAFRTQVTRHWRHALRRRSQKNRLTWARMDRLASRYLPRTRIVHPFPDRRFAASHP
jgi:hypothetical protein